MPTNGGDECPLSETRKCAVDCVSTFEGVSWGKCSSEGVQTREAFVKQQPKNVDLGARPCPAAETRSCPYTIQVMAVEQHGCTAEDANSSKPGFFKVGERSSRSSIGSFCNKGVDLVVSDSDNALHLGHVLLESPLDVVFSYVDSKTKQPKQISIAKLDNGHQCGAMKLDKPYYAVDLSNPTTSLVICPSACKLMKSSAEGKNHPIGTFTLIFKPSRRRLDHMLVRGRNEFAAHHFGVPRKIRPALTFPVHHPAIQELKKCRQGNNKSPIDLTIPKYGTVPDLKGSCSETNGIDLFYARDPNSERSQVLPEDGLGGVSIFFFVNEQDEAYMGIQIGNSENSTNIADEHTYAIIDIILSGDALSGQASWVLVDGVSDLRNPSKISGKARAFLQSSGSKTAGGILGPLPPSNFCIEVLIGEASWQLKHANIVDFVPGYADKTDPSSPQIEAVGSEASHSSGGLKFCANVCSDQTNSTKNASSKCESVGGVLVCPGHSVKFWNTNSTDISGKNSAISGDGATQEGGLESTGGSSAAISRSRVSDSESEDENSQGSWVLWAAILGSASLVVVLILLVSTRRKRENKSQLKYETSLNDVELPRAVGLTRSTNSSDYQYWVPPPPDQTDLDKVSHLRSSSQSTQEERVGTAVALGVSTGFSHMGHKRVSTFEKFFQRWKSTQEPSVKRRGPSIRNIAGSKWDVFYSDEHGCEYYHNKFTGETCWTCPQDIVCALKSPTSISESEWERCYSDDHKREYYHNKRTGESTWTRPSSFSGETSGVVVGSKSGVDVDRVAVAVAVPRSNGASDFVNNPAYSAYYTKFSDPEGNAYFCNTQNGEVSWTLPQGAQLVENS